MALEIELEKKSLKKSLESKKEYLKNYSKKKYNEDLEYKERKKQKSLINYYKKRKDTNIMTEQQIKEYLIARKKSQLAALEEVKLGAIAFNNLKEKLKEI